MVDDAGQPGTGRAVDAYIANLGGAGALDSEGEFTLDAAAAREKMSRFQLAEPHGYVLELVAAAVLRGARRVQVRMDADDVELRFDGQPFSTQDFEELYTAVFSRRQGDRAQRARRELALGLHGCLSLGPRYVRVVKDASFHKAVYERMKRSYVGGTSA